MMEFNGDIVRAPDGSYAWNPEKEKVKGIPGPLAVLEKAREELSEAFVKKGTNDHGIAYLVLYTVSRFAGGFLAASVIAIMLGVILGLNKVLFRAANPFIQIMKPISPLAWMPLLLYTVKDPKWTAVLVVFMAAVWPTLATTAFGVSSLRKEYLHVAAIVQLSWFQAALQGHSPGSGAHDRQWTAHLVRKRAGRGGACRDAARRTGGGLFELDRMEQPRHRRRHLRDPCRRGRRRDSRFGIQQTGRPCHLSGVTHVLSPNRSCHASIFRTRRVPGQVCIFKDATIKIEKGEFVTCIGHSGCGKSTLLNIIAGLETPSEGGIILNGREASGPGLDRMVVFQNFALMPWMTVFENIALAVRSAYPDWSHEQVTAHVNKYIALVGLKGAEDKRPTALSGGMKQRVGLARAFSIEPKVLLLDEPFAQIDALTRGVIQEELIQMWNTSRNTVFMVTHDVDEAILAVRPDSAHDQRPGSANRRDGACVDSAAAVAGNDHRASALL